MKKMIGYQKHPIIGYTEEEIKKIVKSGTDKQLVEIAINTSDFVHHSDTRNQKTKAYATASKYRNILEEKTAVRLRKLDYVIDTQITYRKEGHFSRKTDLHMTFGLCMHDHPTRKSNNFDVTKFIFDDKDKFVSKAELDKKLYADPEIQPISANDFEELEETDKKLVKEFLDSENLTLADIHKINEESDFYDMDGLQITVGQKEYYIIRDISEIDTHMRDYLENDSEYESFYTQGIEEKTIDPIRTCYTDWLDQVIVQGWESIVGTYDGSSTCLSGEAVYFRRN